MASKAEEYVVKLEEFFAELGVTGAYFCAKQYERWRGLAQKAFEEASSSSAASNGAEQKPKRKSVTKDSD